ncbi:hypothetical protein [Modestobacter altitudinis]|uniref:hypothetical protein n=1 Tax=Modestobacter altitudinis TaxID=2213158 RepID=UPI00110CAEC2|nr:hypothetical protein [Modestobacter altitudinis]
MLITVLVAIGGLSLQTRHDEEAPAAVASRCSIPGQDVELTTEQAANAASIAAVARSRGLPPRATVIALATAQQESRLRNLDYGDRDSLGLFQQRPSQGWGSAEQVRDPVYAAGKFFDHLVEVPGWETGDLTTVADAVQRSAFPLAYRQWTGLAEALAPVLLSDQPGQLSCSFMPAAEVATVADRAPAITDAVRREAGTPTLEAGVVSVAGAGWPEASWAVAHADRFQLTAVVMDGWRWTPGSGWENTPSAFARPLQLHLG